MSAAASTLTPSRRKSTSPSAPSLRSICSTAILSSAIVVFLSSSVSDSNDARMTRWPFSWSAWFSCYTTLGDTTIAAREGIGMPATTRDHALHVGMATFLVIVAFLTPSAKAAAASTGDATSALQTVDCSNRKPHPADGKLRDR